MACKAQKMGESRIDVAVVVIANCLWKRPRSKPKTRRSQTFKPLDGSRVARSMELSYAQARRLPY